MNKFNNLFTFFFILITILFFASCEKHDDHDHDIVSNDGLEARLAYVGEGYNEVEVVPAPPNSLFVERFSH